MIGFGILTIFLSGIYPAIVLSRPSPSRILLHNKETDKNKFTFQKSFVVLQFSIVMIIGISQLLIYKQILFLRSHETGFNKENLITIPVGSIGNNGAERMKNTTLFVQSLEKFQAGGYLKTSVTEFVPGFGFRNKFNVYSEDNRNQEGIEMLSCDVDENFLNVYGMHMISGRFFSKDYSSDVDALIINESAMEKTGMEVS